MNKLEWIESGGGPLLLAAKSVVAEWQGNRPSKNVPDLTDYQRACAVQDEIDAIAIGQVQAVVLGDEPDRTAVLLSGADLLILRWRWAESEESLVSALIPEVDRLQFNRSGAFFTVTGEHLLFDSAYAGSEIEESLSVNLDAQEFILETTVFAPSASVNMLIHRLRPS